MAVHPNDTCRFRLKNCGLVVLDEATRNLDSENTGELLELLRRYNAERRQTMVLVTHDPRVKDACSRVLTMQDGVILEG